jgi:hypothetical protein
VKLLANYGALPNARDGVGRTPLSFAAQNGWAEVTRTLLVDYDADPDLADRYGSTPLSIAVRNSHIGVVKSLLATGRADLVSKDSFGRTPLCWAQRCENTAIEKLLLHHAEKKFLPACESNDLAEASPMPGEKLTGWCDVCTVVLPQDEPRYQCGICQEGDFIICLDCYMSGGRCLEDCHTLTLKPRGRMAQIAADGGESKSPDAAQLPC